MTHKEPRPKDPDRPLAREALHLVGLNGRLRRVATGLDSTYSADVGGGRRVAVRVAGTLPIREPAAVAMEGAWIAALGDAGAARVPEVIGSPHLDETLVLQDEDGRHRACLVLSWLAGRKMRWRFARHHAFALGAAAARLHLHAAGFEPPNEAWAKRWEPAALCGPTASRAALQEIAGTPSGVVVAEVEAQLTLAFQQLGPTDWRLVNADLGPHNVVWLDGSPGLFDFNDLGWGYTGFDIGRYLHGLRWRPNGPELVRAALEGYRSVAPLPDSFQLHGALFETAAGLFLAHYLAGRIDERGDDGRRTVRELVVKARQHLDSLSG